MPQLTFRLYQKGRDAPEEAPAKKVMEWTLPEWVRIFNLKDDYTVHASGQAVSLAVLWIEQHGDMENYRYALTENGTVICTITTPTIEEQRAMDDALNLHLARIKPIVSDPLPRYEQDSLL